MKKSREQKEAEVAIATAVIHEKVRAYTNCYSAQGIILPAKYVVFIDDDATSVLEGVCLYYQIRKTHGYCPYVLCVGGNGPLSKFMLKGTEGQMLKEVAMQLGIPEENIIVLDKGMNTGMNIQAVAEIVGDNLVIWSLTQRLSARMEGSIKAQVPSTNAAIYVIEQSVKEVMDCGFNGKGLCNGLAMYSEVAAIAQRIEEYEKQGLMYVRGKLAQVMRGDDVIKARQILEPAFGLKLKANGTKTASLFTELKQFVKLWFALKFSKKQRTRALEKAIRKMRVKLQKFQLAKFTCKIEKVRLSFSKFYGMIAFYKESLSHRRWDN